MKPSFPLRRKLFVSHFLATLVVSSAIGLFFYYTARESLFEQLRARLSGSAALISREIDANELRDIRFERDMAKRAYLEALQSLRQMQRSNDDIAFLYIMRLDEDGVPRFVVDSDETADQALPGMEYRSVTAALLSGFRRQSADTGFATDAWGTFMSGYSPLLNGRGEYLVGIDMRVDDVESKLVDIQRAGLVGLVAALLLSWAIGTWMSRHFREPIEAMISQCQAIAAGDLDRRVEMQRHDEMDSLLVAINEMTSDLRKTREDNLRLAESLDDVLGESRER